MMLEDDCLVLLHGFTGHAEAWKEFVSCLAHPGEICCPCLPGHDPSSRIQPEDNLAIAVDRLAGDLAPSAPVWLAGYSMGGRLALGLALAHPQLVRRLTLIGVNPGLHGANERRARRELEERWIRLLIDEGLEAFFKYWRALPLFASQRELAPARREAQESLRLRHDPRSLARAIELLGLAGMPDYTPSLGELGFPVDLIVGQQDEKFRGLAEGMLKELRSGGIRVIPGTGHNVLLENPAALAKCFEEISR